MRNYNLTLEAECDQIDYYVKRACSSVDLDVTKKMRHHVNIECDFDTDYNIGLIVGNSGSGKTTFARDVFGDIFGSDIDENECVLKQFPDNLKYDQRAELLSNIGLSSIPEWIKPFRILSNGEKARAEIALRLSRNQIIGIDEFTSVVDRNVAKIMSHCIQKYARKHGKKIILCSVHPDIVEWLNPDWVVDMNTQNFIDRRLLWREFRRSERLEFYIAPADKQSWRYFSKYHYLSDNMPGGRLFLYGLFTKKNDIQIGFQCFANYNPRIPRMYHFNRTVIHPEYTGIGLGIILINETSKRMHADGFDVRGKFSNYAIYASMIKSPQWRFLGKSNNFNSGQLRPGKGINHAGRNMQRKFITTYQFKYIG